MQKPEKLKQTRTRSEDDMPSETQAMMATGPGAAKEFEPDDPMELVGIPIPEAETERVVDDIIVEYLFMGWTPRQVFFMFRSPYYGATHAIYRQKGDAYIKERIRTMSEQWRQGWIRGHAQNG